MSRDVKCELSPDDVKRLVVDHFEREHGIKVDPSNVEVIYEEYDTDRLGGKGKEFDGFVVRWTLAARSVAAPAIHDHPVSCGCESCM